MTQAVRRALKRTRILIAVVVLLLALNVTGLVAAARTDRWLLVTLTVPGVICLVALVLRELRIYRRIKRAPEDLARRRIDELAAMPAPDELYRAPDVTKATRRRMTLQQRRPRKRRNGSWG